MLDFVKIIAKSPKKDVIQIAPKFLIKKSTDLMIRGSDFYAIWDEKDHIWRTDENDAIALIDEMTKAYYEEHKNEYTEAVQVLYLWDADSGLIDKWHKYCQKQRRDDFTMLDEKLIFSNDEMKKEDYASKRLPYPLVEGSCPSYDKILSTLYSPPERRKLEWAIGSVVTGDSRHIQKFMVLYGSAGTGKSTVLNIIQQLFDGYYSVFDAKALGMANNSFALEAFKSNPLVAIQHDGDLSHIEDNTRLNSLVSHELMTVNEKFKSAYSNQFKSFLFMGTNKPVKITDAKSGIIRRLIDVRPSGKKLPVKEYRHLMGQIKFELGAIACHCRDVYLEDPGYYDSYVPQGMLGATNDFYNYVVQCYNLFKRNETISLTTAWERYKQYVDDAKVPYPYSQRVFKEELKNYFEDYEEVLDDDLNPVVCTYIHFISDKVNISGRKKKEPEVVDTSSWLDMKVRKSIFDKECESYPAQLAKEDGTPSISWDNVTTTLADLDTSQLHYVRVPENHIVIDFDISKDGKKDRELNLKEAATWPETYAEFSKSGAGVHLHYIYDGDPTKLSRVYDDHVEVKVFTGKSSLRRRLSECNDRPIAHISSGLPTREESKVIDFDGVQTEKGLRTLIKRNLNKEYHPGTKPSIDFIKKILDDAYSSELKYDVSDMRNAVLSFGANSTNHATYCVQLVNKMHFKSDEGRDPVDDPTALMVFYDIEVFPNLFLVNWKFSGEGNSVVRLINPTPAEIEMLIQYNLVGFNNRRYDNHLIYARLIGETNEEIYQRSQAIINGDRNAMFGEAYNISYTDVYDFSSKKQSLKKWEIELGIHHHELGLPWDQPVPEEMWTKVAEYCDDDVLATEAVFNHLHADFVAREILADLAKGTVNDTTNSLTTKIIFGSNRHPQLVYTDLSEEFPGYEFKYNPETKHYENLYRGVDLGFGGYVYAEEGAYSDVALLDVASLHPHSIIALNAFGEYTKNFKDLMDARIFVKHRDYDSAKELFDGKLTPYLDDPAIAKTLAYALKIAINSVYGLTSASFDNPFRDPRNKNNIVALRGALFMKTLQDEVAAKGYTVAHIKTDSIKIPNADRDIIDFCMKFAEKYGYQFEHEATYDRMCLVNNSTYIAKYSTADQCQKLYGYIPEDCSDHGGQWTATAAQFAEPYVFKKLFSHEDISFKDLCVTKSVTTALYLDMNEGLSNVEEAEKEAANRLWNSKHEKPKRLNPIFDGLDDDALAAEIARGHNYCFVGKVGSFTPIKPGHGGGELVRIKDGKYYAATGTKRKNGEPYFWLEAETVESLGKESDVDRSYFDALVDDAVESISRYCDFEGFTA
jgi:hypothetical protein